MRREKSASACSRWSLSRLLHKSCKNLIKLSLILFIILNFLLQGETFSKKKRNRSRWEGRNYGFMAFDFVFASPSLSFRLYWRLAITLKFLHSETRRTQRIKIILNFQLQANNVIKEKKKITNHGTSGKTFYVRSHSFSKPKNNHRSAIIDHSLNVPKVWNVIVVTKIRSKNFSAL